MERLKVGISIGDFNGIGLEVILKALSEKNMLNFCTPIIYGSSKVVSYHKNIVDVKLQFQTIRAIEQANRSKVNVFNCWNENANITLGKPSADGGRYALLSLDKVVEDLKSGLIDALVTAPINKSAMKMAEFPYPGHTEYLTSRMGGRESLMLMVSDNLKVGLVTNHLPLRDVPDTVVKERVDEKLNILLQSLKMDFGIERPVVAVLGLNPHAGDDGAIGPEEEKIIRPVVIENKKKGAMVFGPFSADAFFGSGQYTKFDGVLAMYHDQGLIPFKTLSFGKGVNFTAGLPYVRTSPDHGTAYDLAGKNSADCSSFRSALFAAIDIARQRKTYLEMHENTLVKRELVQEESSEEELVDK